MCVNSNEVIYNTEMMKIQEEAQKTFREIEAENRKMKKGKNKGFQTQTNSRDRGLRAFTFGKGEKLTNIISNLEERITSHLGTFIFIFIGFIFLSFLLRKYTLDLQNLPDMTPTAIYEISKIRKAIFFMFSSIGIIMLLIVYTSLKSFFDNAKNHFNEDESDQASDGKKYEEKKYHSQISQWMFMILVALIFYLTVETYYEFDSDLNLNLSLFIQNQQLVTFFNSLGFTILQLPILIAFVFFTSIQMFTFEHEEKQKIKRLQDKIKEYITNHRIVKKKRYDTSDSILVSEIEMLLKKTNQSYESILWVYKRVSQLFYFLISSVTTFILKLFDLKIWIIFIFIASLMIVKLFTYSIIKKWCEIRKDNILI